MSADRRRIRFARPPRILRYSWRIFLNISPSVEQLVNSTSPRLFWNSPALTQRFKYARLTSCPCPTFCSCAIETLDWSRWLPLDRFFLRWLPPVLPFVFLLGSRREFSIIYKFIQFIYKWTGLFINGLDHTQIRSSFINGRSIHKWTKMAARLHKNPLTE